jgi:hypothetical protein
MRTRLSPLLQLTLGALTCVALNAVVTDTASAQDRARPAPAPAPIVELDPIDVFGRAHGPGAFYVLPRDQRADLNREPRELRRTFVRDIVESVSREPF